MRHPRIECYCPISTRQDLSTYQIRARTSYQSMVFPRHGLEVRGQMER
jgi:hypothetical protein